MRSKRVPGVRRRWRQQVSTHAHFNTLLEVQLGPARVIEQLPRSVRRWDFYNEWGS